MARKNLNRRQEEILTTLDRSGHVAVEYLANSYAVTAQTIRRDLGELCDRGLALRIHGGAKKLLTTSAIAYEERRANKIEAKKRMASAVSQLIGNGATIGLNIGTTIEHVAEELQLHDDITIISNNINISYIMRNSNIKSLVLIGGEVRLSDGAIVGADAIEAVSKFKTDFAIIGASCLDEDGSILDFDQREVAVARALLANARTKVLVCDSSKFQVSAPFRICNLSDLDFVVTDQDPPAQFVQAAEYNRTELIIV